MLCERPSDFVCFGNLQVYFNADKSKQTIYFLQSGSNFSDELREATEGVG